ncbi:hypothetical protein [Halomonas campaniensis]|uniref:Uncharacterized protein n=1 Tax=Halomonas campaniensis TaxID=213554 RepID=A0A246RYQ7_9GAMM|nr:hypothetical protein [Halomonas campaniensis]OWV29293.1 hypothetical protein JI62_17085 [Halomonas campaniensis]
MNTAKRHIDALESRIGLMASLANIINIDRMRDGNEGEAPILNDYYYGSLVEAIEIVAESCYRELSHLDDASEEEVAR